MLPMALIYPSSSNLSFDQLCENSNMIETKEDYAHYDVFKKNYETNIKYLDNSKTVDTIPKIFHFIWLGERSLPKEMCHCIRSWIKQHSDWKAYLWVDFPHPSPDKRLQRKSIQTLAKMMPSFFTKIDNRADQSLIVRMLALREFGGVYLDGDVQCKTSINELISKVNFVTSISIQEQPILSSSVQAMPFFIGSKPHHPIIDQTWKTMLKGWGEVEDSFNGDDQESYVYRSAYHTYIPFTEACLTKACNLDLILPSGYFSKTGTFGRHLELKSWTFKDEALEEVIESKILSFLKHQKKTHQALLYTGGFSCLILCALGVVVFMKKSTGIPK